MITDKIKALFQFIEYLHSNIENFNQYNGLISELKALYKDLYRLKPELNYKDKIQYNEVLTEIDSKSKILQDNTTNLIKDKAKELNVCNFNKEPLYNFYGIETDIRQLKDNFSNKDLSEIFRYKSLYIEYRSRTDKDFLYLIVFFDILDQITKNLFDYFKDTEQNEFEPFETKAIPVNSITEVIQGIKQGQTKFSLTTQRINKPKPEQKEKHKPKLNNKIIIIKNNETIEKIHSELKGYFPNKEIELLKALQGEQLSEILLFPNNQNKFVEVFRRLKYNGFILNNDTEIKNWICKTFQYVKKGFTEPQPFNENTVWNNLNKGIGEPTKKERICFENVDWLPYKSPKQLKDAAQKEKL